MPQDKHYIPGTFWRICDRTGFKTRSFDTQMEWQGLIVDKRVFETRQPQDFVRGVEDNQTVPYARPRPRDGIAGNSLIAEFQVYGDLPGRVSFEVQNGSMMVNHARIVVTASSYPASA